jgi:hypothetical protein
MLSSKLRKRREPLNGPTLPLHASEDGFVGVRRRKPIKSSSAVTSTGLGRIIVGCICLSVVLLSFVGLARTVFPAANNASIDNDRMRGRIFHRVQRHFGRKQRKGERQMISCPDGSKGVLNDNYCDCADGRDEPGTAACSHLTVQRETFACADGSRKIYASRVRDGVTDCPDGSDER